MYDLLKLKCLIEQSDDPFICRVCNKIVDSPCGFRCEHVVCYKCVTSDHENVHKRRKTKKVFVICPVCRDGSTKCELKRHIALGDMVDAYCHAKKAIMRAIEDGSRELTVDTKRVDTNPSSSAKLDDSNGKSSSTMSSDYDSIPLNQMNVEGEFYEECSASPNISLAIPIPSSPNSNPQTSTKAAGHAGKEASPAKGTSLCIPHGPHQPESEFRHPLMSSVLQTNSGGIGSSGLRGFLDDLSDDEEEIDEGESDSKQDIPNGSLVVSNELETCLESIEPVELESPISLLSPGSNGPHIWSLTRPPVNTRFDTVSSLDSNSSSTNSPLIAGNQSLSSPLDCNANAHTFTELNTWGNQVCALFLKFSYCRVTYRDEFVTALSTVLIQLLSRCMLI